MCTRTHGLVHTRVHTWVGAGVRVRVLQRDVGKGVRTGSSRGGLARCPGGPLTASVSCFSLDCTGVTGFPEYILKPHPVTVPECSQHQSLDVADGLPPTHARKSLSTHCVQGDGLHGKQGQRPSRLRGWDHKDHDSPGLRGHASGERAQRTPGQPGPPLPPTACRLLGDPAGPRASPGPHPGF